MFVGIKYYSISVLCVHVLLLLSVWGPLWVLDCFVKDILTVTHFFKRGVWRDKVFRDLVLDVMSHLFYYAIWKALWTATVCKMCYINKMIVIYKFGDRCYRMHYVSNCSHKNRSINVCVCRALWTFLKVRKRQSLATSCQNIGCTVNESLSLWSHIFFCRIQHKGFLFSFKTLYLSMKGFCSILYNIFSYLVTSCHTFKQFKHIPVELTNKSNIILH